MGTIYSVRIAQRLGQSEEAIPNSSPGRCVRCLASERPYKKPFSVEKSLAIVEDGRDRHFDGAVLDEARVQLALLHAEFVSLSDTETEAVDDRIIAGWFPIG